MKMCYLPPVLLFLSQTLSQEAFTLKMFKNWENLPRDTLSTYPVSCIILWQIATDYLEKTVSETHTEVTLGDTQGRCK